MTVQSKKSIEFPKALPLTVGTPAGFSLIEVIVSISILLTSAVIMTSRMQQLLVTAELDKAAYTIASVDASFRGRMTAVFQEVQRMATESGCDTYFHHVTSEPPKQGLLKLPESKIGVAAAAAELCNTHGIQPTTDLRGKDSFVYCFADDNAGHLVIARAVFWDFHRNEAIICDNMPETPGRGLQAVYTVHGVSKIRAKGSVEYSLRQYSGQIMVPKAVFKDNKTATQVTEDEVDPDEL